VRGGGEGSGGGGTVVAATGTARTGTARTGAGEIGAAETSGRGCGREGEGDDEGGTSTLVEAATGGDSARMVTSLIRTGRGRGESAAPGWGNVIGCNSTQASA
jgi:hypothetical protein